MTREARAIVISVLTFCLLSIIFYFDKGAIIFPFPLNDILIGVIALTFAFWNRKHLSSSIFVAFIGFMFLCRNQFIWVGIFSHEKVAYLISHGWLDLFKFFASLGVLTAGILTALKQKKTLTSILNGAFILLYSFGFLQNNLHYILLSLVVIVVSTQIKKVYVPFQLLWVLLLTLYGMEWLTRMVNNVT